MIRVFDLLFSLISLIFLLPIFLLIIPLLKFTGEGEVFYSQKRIGKDLKTFSIFKFATMKKDSPNMTGGTITVENDPRILPLGHFLRTSKINELPQIFNIFLGDMSFIGPRPCTAETLAFYENESKKIIFSKKPGLSGIGSIIFRNEEEILSGEDREVFYSEHIAPYKQKLEEWFANNASLQMYFFLMFLTIYVVLNKKTKIQYKIFKSLPKPSKFLEEKL